MTESISGYEAIRRPVLVEYAEVLTIMDQLIAMSKNERDPGQQASRARQIVQLIRQLKTMEITSLSATVDLKDLARALTVRSGALTQIVSTPGATLQQIADAYADWIDGSDGESGAEALIRKALNPKEWKHDLPANDGAIDPLFYEYYRAAQMLSQQHTGELKERLEALSAYTQSLSTIRDEMARQSERAEQAPSKALTEALSTLRTLEREEALELEGSTQQRTKALLKLWDQGDHKESQIAQAMEALAQEGIEGARPLQKDLEEAMSKVLMQYEAFRESAQKLTHEHAQRVEGKNF